jgi:hypothetical protein
MDDNFSFAIWATAAVVTVGLVLLGIIAGWHWMNAETPAEEPLMICPNCGNFGHTQEVRPGSDLMTILLLLFLIVPGIFYALWRQLNVRRECPICHQSGMVPHHSPRGIKLQNEFHSQK